MKFSLPLAALSLASAVVASASTCITHASAELFISRFSSVLTHQNSDLGDPETTGNAILAVEYEEISDSILSLVQDPTKPVSPSSCGLGIKREKHNI